MRFIGGLLAVIAWICLAAWAFYVNLARPVVPDRVDVNRRLRGLK